jgi:hypothetical protein
MSSYMKSNQMLGCLINQGLDGLSVAAFVPQQQNYGVATETYRPEE